MLIHHKIEEPIMFQYANYSRKSDAMIYVGVNQSTIRIDSFDSELTRELFKPSGFAQIIVDAE